MKYDRERALQILTRTPGLLDAWLSGLDEAWVHARDREGAWSPCEVVAHLIHGEVEDWIPRARILLEHGEARPFTPFERSGYEAYARGRSLSELLETFAARRAENCQALRSLPVDEETLERTGMHPTLGRITLRHLLATWTAHDLAHVAQIARTLARQYRAEVGPWSHEDFMPVFTR